MNIIMFDLLAQAAVDPNQTTLFPIWHSFMGTSAKPAGFSQLTGQRDLQAKSEQFDLRFEAVPDLNIAFRVNGCNDFKRSRSIFDAVDRPDLDSPAVNPVHGEALQFKTFLGQLPFSLQGKPAAKAGKPELNDLIVIKCAQEIRYQRTDQQRLISG